MHDLQAELSEYGTWKGRIKNVWSLLRPSWRDLAATDLMYKLVAYVLITPLFLILFRVLLQLSGRQVLSDLDIATFFAGPVGWCCGVAIGGVWLAILAFEQSSLLWILCQRERGQTAHMFEALRFAAKHAPSVLRVAIRVMAWTAAAVTPFLLVAIGIYFALLTEFDINYYLAERPAEFQTAVILGGLLACLLGIVLLRLYSGWFLALPLVLFEKVPPRQALATSKRLVEGHRFTIVVALIVLAGLVFVSNVVGSLVIGLVGRLLIPADVGSLAVLAACVGLMFFVSGLAGIVVQMVAAIGFAGTMMQSYRSLSPDSSVVLEQSESHTDRVWKRGYLTGPRLSAAGILLALLVTVIGFRVISTVRLQDDAQIMAHRGASFLAPENSLAAFRQAIADGADWIEIDVQETSDGEVVVVHDKDLMKLSGQPINVWQSSLSDLSAIDIGSQFDSKFSRERVPTLDEVLRLCKHQIGVIIELKYYGHAQRLEQRVVEIVERHEMADQVMVMSLKREGVAKTKKLRPDWKYGLLLSVYVGKLEQIDTDFLAINAKFASRQFIKRAHQAGKEVYVWTVDEPAEMSMLLNRNVDGILTNRPALARDVLQQRSELSSSERLLAEISVWLKL